MDTDQTNETSPYPHPWHIESHDLVSSTMVTAHDALPRMARNARWGVMATSQQSGYGRRGHVWHSPPGNLYATLVHGVHGPLTQPGRWGVAVSLAIYDGCITLGVPPGDLTLKWPNDLLLNGGKVAGILMETRSDYPHLILVGIGVNIGVIPHGLPYKGSCLQDSLGRIPTPDQVLRAILAALDAIIQHMNTEDDWTTLKNRWLSHAFAFGQWVTLIPRPGDQTAGTPPSPISGVFCDMDADGAMVMDHGNGQKMIYRSGDVSLGFNTITSSG